MDCPICKCKENEPHDLDFHYQYEVNRLSPSPNLLKEE